MPEHIAGNDVYMHSVLWNFCIVCLTLPLRPVSVAK